MNFVQVKCNKVGCDSLAVCSNAPPLGDYKHRYRCGGHCDHSDGCVCLFNGKPMPELTSDEREQIKGFIECPQ